MYRKILTFVVKDNKFLLLKGSNNDPEFHESFWYVVTGGVENSDNNLEDTVRREVFEETGIDLEQIKYLNWSFVYKSLGKMCHEKAFVSFYKDGEVQLNEESIDYKWCNIDEVIDKMKWYGDKDKLKYVLECILEDKVPFEKEEVELF